MRRPLFNHDDDQPQPPLRTLERIARQLAAAEAAPSPAPALMAASEKRRRVRRKLAADFEALRLYEPLPHAEVFHQDNVPWRLVTSSNKGGKSLAALVEAAWAVTGQHPYSHYPRQNAVAMFVGLKWSHISQLYQGMFCPGLFQVIRDEHTKRWRSVRYDRNEPTKLQQYDLAYREKWRDAPPLIPKRWIKGRIAWEASSKDCPSVIHLINGWRLYWYSAMGEPERGRHYNFVLFDEEMPNADFYNEAHRGLIRLHESPRTKPKGVWAATAQIANPEFANLREQAEADPTSPLVRIYQFDLAKNPYVEPDAQRAFAAGLSDDERATRVLGIPAISWRRVYPMFDPRQHCCEPFEIPADYTRYFYADPGRRHNCTIFVAVDPDERHWIVYDGFDIPGGAEDWAAAVAQRQAPTQFEAGVFDQQMGNERNVGLNNQPVAAQYFQAAQAAGVQIRALGPLNGFFPGCNRVEDRESALRSAMVVRGAGPHEGTAQLQIFAGALPELERQIKRAHTDPRRPDKRYKSPNVPEDWVTVAEYLAAHKPCYRRPEAVEEDAAPVQTAWGAYQEFKKRRQQARRHGRPAERRSYVALP